jgi:guanylate kinase
MAIFTITAPSGAGKTSIAQMIQAQGKWDECISCTTRDMREGEVNGVTYYFLQEDEFADTYQMGEFAEYVEYDGNYYGITKREIERVLEKGKHVFIIVEYNGYTQIKEQYPDSVGIFLYMSKEDCMANMLLRGDSMENATKRIKKYDKEMANKKQFDYAIKNVRGKMASTVRIINGIISQYD